MAAQADPFPRSRMRAYALGGSAPARMIGLQPAQGRRHAAGPLRMPAGGSFVVFEMERLSLFDGRSPERP